MMLTSRQLLTASDLDAATELLRRENLLLPEGSDYGVGYFLGSEIAATGFRKGSTLMGLCVAREHRGGGLAGRLMTHLLHQANSCGLGHLFLFTKPSQRQSFEHLGFGLVAESANHAALLEFGWPDFEAWMNATKREVVQLVAGKMLGAIVMNANPFTLGHRSLIEYAAKACDWLLVFVVQEDASEFPYDVRLRLVRVGTAHIANCSVLPGGPYMVSRSTFPSYFTGHDRHAAVHAALDATVFATRIAPQMGVVRRFVGTEPYSAVTSIYNDALAEILPPAGVELCVLDRTEKGGEAISASRVRGLLACGDIWAARSLVPETTAAWWETPDAIPVLDALVERHRREVA